jgi:hypothetical protein
MDYYKKYQKYRFKYLNLLNQTGGVGNDDVSITKLINIFNTFFKKIIDMKKNKLDQLKININNELIILEKFKELTDDELKKLEEETNNKLKELKDQLDKLKVQTDQVLEELKKLQELDEYDRDLRDLETQIFYLNNEFKFKKDDITYKNTLKDLEGKKKEWTMKLKELKNLEVQTKKLEDQTKELKAIKAIKAIKVHQTIKAIESLKTFKELTDKELEELKELKELTNKELGVFENELKQFEQNNHDKIVEFDRQLKLFTRDKYPKSTYDEQLKRRTYNYNQQITYKQLQKGTDENLLKLHENIVIYELDAVLKYLGIVDVIDTDIFEIILTHLDPGTRRNDTNMYKYFLIYNKAISHISRISYIKDTQKSNNFQIINYSSEDYLLNNFKIITIKYDMILENEYNNYYSKLNNLNKSNEIFVDFINNLTKSKITILPFFSSSSYLNQQNINKLNFEQKHRIYQIAISHNTQKDNVLNNFNVIVNNHDFNWVLGNVGIKYGEKYLEFCELLFNNINYDNSYNYVCQNAVTKNGLALKYIPDMTLTEEEYLKIYEIAVNQNGLALEFVDKNKMNDTEYLKICEIAVNQNLEAKQYKK